MKYDFRPLSQEVYTITPSSEERLEGEMWLGKAEAGPPLHKHPFSEERLTLVKGKLQIYRNGQWEIIEAETSWNIPPEEIHTFKGAEDSDATVKFSIIPPKGFAGFLTDTQALIQSGKLKSYESLNGLIYSSMLVKRYKDTLVPSQFYVKVIMPIANFFGIITGKRVKYAI